MKKVLLTAIIAAGTIFAANAGGLTIGIPGFYLNIGDNCYTTTYTTPYAAPVYVTPPAPVYVAPAVPVRYYRPILPPPRHYKPVPRHHGRGGRHGHRR